MSDGEYRYPYPRPMLTADVVVVSGSRARLSVLLIQRGNPPFAGSWALPGGFVDEGEQVHQTAPRELAEETGLQLDEPELLDELELLGVYDTPGRDPRGWTVSAVYVARVRSELPVHGSDDAGDARWFAIDELPPLAFDHAEIVKDALARFAR